MRLAGVGLLGVAVISVVIGLVGLTGGEDETAAHSATPVPGASITTTATGTTSNPVPTGADGQPVPTGADGRPVPTGPDGRPVATGPDGRPGTDGLSPVTDTNGRPLQPGGTPGTATNPPADPGLVVGEPVGTRPNVRVYNNSTIKGLAQRARTDLISSGWPVVEIGNYPHGRVYTTTVYFRPGTDEEPAARAIATAFGMRCEARFDGIQQASPGVIVIVTNDYKGPPAS